MHFFVRQHLPAELFLHHEDVLQHSTSAGSGPVMSWGVKKHVAILSQDLFPARLEALTAAAFLPAAIKVREKPGGLRATVASA